VDRVGGGLQYKPRFGAGLGRVAQYSDRAEVGQIAFDSRYPRTGKGSYAILPGSCIILHIVTAVAV